MKRKSPIRHTVRPHTRRGKSVRTFVRGQGSNLPKIKVTKRKILVRRVENDLNGFRIEGWHARYHTSVTGPKEEITRRVNVSLKGHFKNWSIGGVKASGISYDHEKRKIMIMDKDSYHEPMEEAAGYGGTGINKSKLTRFTLMPDGKEYRVYTYRAGKGIDGYPLRSAKLLDILLERKIISPEDKIRIYFKRGISDISGSSHTAKRAVQLLKVIGRE